MNFNIEDRYLKHSPSADVLAFIANTFPAGVSGKVLEHYQRSGELPKRITFQTSLNNDFEVYYPRQAFASHMFGIAKAALNGVCETRSGHSASASIF